MIYAVMKLVWSGLILYGFADGLLPRLVQLATLIILCAIAGRSLRFNSWTDILPYSVFWMIEVLLIDAVFSFPVAGVALYLDWNLWVGYALVVLLPLFAPYTRKQHALSHSL